jgi:hypothetical protein
LLVNVLKDQRFINASRVFSTDLISHVILQKKSQEEFKLLITKTIKDDDVRDETINLLTYLVGTKQSEEIVAKLMSNVLLR